MIKKVALALALCLSLNTILCAIEPVIVHPYWAKNIPNGVPQEVNDIVEFIHSRQLFEATGAQMPKGFLLYGPPGTGKTSIARAIANATNAAFFFASASEFAQPYVGQGASLLRKYFEEAQKKIECGEVSTAIIFIDEIELIAAKRSAVSLQKWNDDVLTELLTQIDGFQKNPNVFVIGATNLLDNIDPALLRAGRLSRQIEIPLPNVQGREAILGHYLQKVKACDDVTGLEKKLAPKLKDFSGADIESMINEAAISATRDKSYIVKRKHIIDAIELVKKRKNVKGTFKEIIEFAKDLRKPIAQAVVTSLILGGLAFVGSQFGSSILKPIFKTRDQHLKRRPSSIIVQA